MDQGERNAYELETLHKATRKFKRTRKAKDCGARCNEPCGEGLSTRTRFKTANAAHGGAACEGLASEQTACEITPCPVDFKPRNPRHFEAIAGGKSVFQTYC